MNVRDVRSAHQLELQGKGDVGQKVEPSNGVGVTICDRCSEILESLDRLPSEIIYHNIQDMETLLERDASISDTSLRRLLAEASKGWVKSGTVKLRSCNAPDHSRGDSSGFKISWTSSICGAWALEWTTRGSVEAEIPEHSEELTQPSRRISWVDFDPDQWRQWEDHWILRVISGEPQTTSPRLVSNVLETTFLPSTKLHTLKTLRNKNSTWELLRSWVHECRSSHARCSAEQSSTLPTRLLELHERSFQLRLSSTLDHEPKYATLSHCWGNFESLRLSGSNVALFEKGLPQNVICQTFQDAIRVTQELGLRYLWIDSLCIIQDDESDKERECARMHDIYSADVVNIAAADAKDGSVGCFLGREIRTQSSSIVFTTVSGQPGWYSCIEENPYRRHISQSLLAKRGWCLQERILAKQMIHFGARQVVWECRTKTACEELPFGIPRCASDSQLRTFGEIVLHRSSLLELWPRIIEFYSKCQLSRVEDKLTAIAGIAERAHCIKSSQYLAGLWAADLESQLLWSLDAPLKPRSPIYLAPTWSWASLEEGAIYTRAHSYPRDKLCAHVIVASTTVPRGIDPFGAVRSGILQLSCRYLLKVLPLRDGVRIRTNKVYGSISLDCIPSQTSEFFLLLMWDITWSDVLYTCCVLLESATRKGEFYRVGKVELDVWRLAETIGETNCKAAESVYAGFCVDSRYPDEPYFIDII